MRFLFFLVLISSTSLAFGAQLKLNGAGASTGIVVGDIDAGEALSNRGSSKATSTGTLGRTNTSGLTNLGEWDEVSFCEYAPGVLGLLLTYESGSFIDTAANGDQLYRVLSAEPASTLCFDFTNERFTFTLYQDVVGGTGRFEGATGTAVTKGSGQNVGEGHSAFTFSLKGKID